MDMISLNQLELWPKVKLSGKIKVQLTLTKFFIGSSRGKSYFFEPAIVLHSFSSGTILIIVIWTIQLEIWTKVKLSDLD